MQISIVKSLNEHFFDNIDTPEKSYLLGFFAGDGYITKDRNSYRIGLQNSIDDFEVIKEFRDHICPNSNLPINHKDGKKDQVHLRWTSKHMFDILCSYGLGLNKTSNFNFNMIIIPKSLRNHFIRGYFDADGSFSCENIMFCFNSLDFANEVINELKEVAPFINCKIEDRKTYLRARLSFQRSKSLGCYLLCKYLYKDARIILERKRLQFENYFKYRANLDWTWIA